MGLNPEYSPAEGGAQTGRLEPEAEPMCR